MYNFTSKQLLLSSGIMSTPSHLSTRVEAAVGTWLRAYPGVKIEVFSGKKKGSFDPGVDVVSMPGVKDKEYPPQRKSFRMMKYMHDSYINE